MFVTSRDICSCAQARSALMPFDQFCIHLAVSGAKACTASVVASSAVDPIEAMSVTKVQNVASARSRADVATPPTMWRRSCASRYSSSDASRTSRGTVATSGIRFALATSNCRVSTCVSSARCLSSAMNAPYPYTRSSSTLLSPVCWYSKKRSSHVQPLRVQLSRLSRCAGSEAQSFRACIRS